MPLTNQPLFAQLVFWGLAFVGVIAALLVIHLRDLFRAVLALTLFFLTIAGLLVLLHAEFLAAAQVLIYAGAIAILIVFAVMLTRDVETGNPSHRFQVPVAILAALMLAAITWVVYKAEWRLVGDENLSPQAEEALKGVFSDTPGYLAQNLLNDYALPFEVVSVVLLAAIIGAIVLIRER